MTQILVAGRSFHVRLEGEATLPVLMLAHPLGADLTVWDRQIEAFSPYFRTLRYDARGHGKSAVPDGPYSLTDLGRDALGIMDALDIDQVHWLGQSLGGMVGQWLLTHAPERIERAVLANTTARPGDPNAWNARIGAVRRHGMEAVTDTVLERWFTAKFRAAHQALIEPIRQCLLRTSPKGYIGCCAAIRDMDLHEAIRSVRQPVLVIMGDADPSTPPAEGLAIAETISGAATLLLESAHLSHIEAEAPFNKAVIDFLTAPLRKIQPKQSPASGRLNARRPAPARPVAKQAAKKTAQETANAKQAETLKAPAKKAKVKTPSGKKEAAKKAAIKKVRSRKGLSDKTLDKSPDTAKEQAEKIETLHDAPAARGPFSRRQPPRRP